MGSLGTTSADVVDRGEVDEMAVASSLVKDYDYVCVSTAAHEPFGCYGLVKRTETTSETAEVKRPTTEDLHGLHLPQSNL